ncbi:OmpP1/FadL family transporter [Phyllobacterium sp. 21LDTY02-6]|uniref:OmpP1/FadL family transporter n=1 Tax=unclassified Phyllobacterium TaxID=2638441 RepID=UPI0020225C62|nr:MULTISPECIES: OmpP1/FadL family transporter [unclassified Phyllobacterium]MCO4316383.1 OmpP1/FadL family transporter [Phyllobacterium sp. 21LDTY02-6]MCX8280814.1 OmpP1/FadL family transporter [Phyllobacterium sp. 0TCS1.6C]MCX8292609.1 OmpP1/FadL family transporter [Phyllobacterium sp. 0TCS1.6A]
MAKTVSTVLGGALLLTSIATAAQAGGLERGGYNWDLLFSEERFASEAGVIYVMPDRRIKNARDTDPTDGMGANGAGGGATSVDETEDYAIPRFGAKVGLTPEFDCLASYSQPWGVHTKPGSGWVGANENIETKVESHDYGLTCSYKFDVGKGFVRAIGGVSYQEVEGFKERLVLGQVLQTPYAAAGFDGTGVLDLEGDGYGWRIGASYEIPEIALRASLIYNAEVDLGQVNGTVDVTEVPAAFANPKLPFAGRVIDVYGTATMPQSVEFKLQSGFAPNWLAYGSVKWVDWSVLDVIAFCPTSSKGAVACGPSSPARVTSLDLMFRDGWTVTAGVGHKFNDQWSGSVQVSWDRGTSTGLTTQTDTWLLSSGVAWSPNKNVELRVGGAVGILTSGSFGPTECVGNQPCGTKVRYDFDDDFVSALSISGKVKF